MGHPPAPGGVSRPDFQCLVTSVSFFGDTIAEAVRKLSEWPGFGVSSDNDLAREINPEFGPISLSYSRYRDKYVACPSVPWRHDEDDE